MLLRVVHCDKQVAGFCGGVEVLAVCFQVVVQLQPVEQRGRRDGTRRLDRRAVGQPGFLPRTRDDTASKPEEGKAANTADRLMLILSVNGALVELLRMNPASSDTTPI